ncbi:hypothetical protein B0H14DRAFT_2569631 [Mycena olivaceomarginata]|nr:hypothetical protein B0H14DRAFT_2569631 [Mycena olivaceomarginata]
MRFAHQRDADGRSLIQLTTCLFSREACYFRLNNTVQASQGTFRVGWVGLEQFFIASVDVGRLDVADSLKQLADRFPESPRVDVVAGIRLEVTESPDVLLQYYTQLLDADSANALELADIYTTCNRYVSFCLSTLKYLNQYNPRYILAFQALLHVLLVALQNPFYALQFAETAYTASDLSLALKTFPVVVDMCGRDLDSPEKGPFRLTTSFCWGSRWLMVNSSLSASNSPRFPKSRSHRRAGHGEASWGMF